ncbi:hypothetical protein ANN_05730 [Periplaneta americana]|uniref:Ionotropic glutamate receptor C-terminal domain-containing protein n=1 Tax=Periplaneta americana TaxID=6978 RepID=A0ABQ8TDC2_PERAM|nr:hypothetical protein ANN_05730 [Periplaneta americana]
MGTIKTMCITFASLIICSSSEDLQLAQCLLHIMKRNFLPELNVIISYDDEVSKNSSQTPKCLRCAEQTFTPSSEVNTLINMEVIHSSQQISFLLMSRRAEIQINTNVDALGIYGNFILISEYEISEDIIDDVTQQLLNLRHSMMWNARQRFVAAVPNVRNDSKERVAEDVLAAFWKHNVINAIVLTPSYQRIPEEEQVPLMNVYTWFPYHPVGRCANVKDAVLVDQWVVDGEDETYFLYNASLFPKKTGLKFTGCTLTIGTFEYAPVVMDVESQNNVSTVYKGGTEVFLTRIIAEKMNMSLVVLNPPADGWRWGFETNGKWTGVTGMLINGECDTVMGNWYYRCHLVEEVECITQHNMDDTRWFVPCAKPYPRWLSITRVFQPSLWLSFFLTYVTIAFVMRKLVQIKKSTFKDYKLKYIYNSLVECLLDFWAVILGQSACDIPQVTLIRSLFLLWLVMCLAINTVYQTFLTTFLIEPGLQQQISSEDELLNSNLVLGIPDTYVSLYPDLKDDRYKRQIHCPNVLKCQDRVALKGDMSVLFSILNTEYVTATRHTDGSGKPKICRFYENYSNQFVSFPFLKGNPYTERFEQIVFIILESGLKEKWWSDIKYIATLKSILRESSTSDDYVQMSLEHFQSAFLLLVLGYILALLSLFLEICCRYRKPRYALKHKNLDKEINVVKDKNN